jgi:5-methylcytosine-specific restriction endonuclease McrA
MSVREIAAALSISRPTVCYHKRKLGYEMNERFACRYDWSAIQRYYDLGYSTRQCQKRFGFSSWAWAYAVKRGDVIPRPQAMPLEELLAVDTPRSRNHVKLRLLRVGLKKNRCEECGISRWRDRSLSLALHHVNGDRHDNRLENLQLLCPNCHSQTPNFGSKNKRPLAA